MTNPLPQSLAAQELPRNWVTAKIGDFLVFGYGKGLTRNARDELGEVPVYGSSGIAGYHIAPLIHEACLIVGRKGAAGAVHISRVPSWPIDTAYFIRAPSGFDLSFLYYLLSTAQLDHLDKSTAIPSLSRDDAYAVQVRFPSANEQKRIVEKLEQLLSELDKAIDSLKAAQEKLKTYRRAVLKAAVEGELSREWREANEALEQWKTVKLGNVSSSRLGKMLDKQKNQGTPAPYLRNINVRWFDFDLSDILEIKVTEQERSSLTVKKNDVLVCEGGEPGRCAVWRDTDETYVYQKALHRVRLSESVQADWLCYCLKDAADSGRLKKLFTGTTINHLTGVSLSRFEFTCPSTEEQRFIINEVETLFSLLDKMEAEISRQHDRSKSLRQSILQKAFSGQLVQQDPNDEPASVLLERIRAEREAQGAQGKRGKKKTKVAEMEQPRLLEVDA